MISTKGRYALRVMVDIAQQPWDRYIPLKEIAERQQISKKYLETIVHELAKAKMIRGVSGKGGGYMLARKPEEYTLGEIIEEMEGTLAPVACLAGDKNVCPRADKCATLPMWEEYNKLIKDFFYSKKLSDLIK